MKKKLLTFLILCLTFCMSACIFTACSDSGNGKTEYKISFIVGGNLYDTLNTAGNEVLTLPENPEMSGYTFDGWYQDNNVWLVPFTSNSFADAPLSQDLRVYAKWTLNTVSVDSVTLNKTSVAMRKGSTQTLIATVAPYEANDKTLTWKSTNTQVATVSNGVITAVSEGTATIRATAVGGKSATCEVTVVNGKITLSDDFVLDGLTATYKVNNDVETYSLENKIQTTGSATYTIVTDLENGNAFSGNEMNLAVGDNILYVLEKVGDSTTVYTLNVRRRPMYSVTFDTKGGSNVDGIQVQEDGTVDSTSITAPTKTGYTFDGWDFDFETIITENTVINAKWTANNSTAYKVEYYLENANNNEYTVDASLTENKTGTTGSEVFAQIKTVEHFTAEATEVKGNVNADGSLVLKVYYKRNKYSVTFNGNGGTLVSGNETQSVKYQANAVAPVYTKTGYTLGFDKPLTITSETTITATWTAKTFTVKFDVDGGVGTYEDATATYDANFTLPTTNPTKDNSDFDGWYFGDSKVENGSWSIDSASQVITLKAKYKTNIIVENGTVVGVGEQVKSAKTLTIPKTVDGMVISAIGPNAFAGCTELETIVLSDSITYVDALAFNGLTKLTYKEENGINYLGTSDNAYFLMVSVKDTTATSLTVNDNVKVIVDGVLNGLENLTYYTDNGVKYLGNESNNYLVLVSVDDATVNSLTIKKETKVIVNGALNDLTAISSFTVEEDNNSFKAVDGNLYSYDGKTLIRYAVGKYNTDFIVSTTVTTISSGAFAGATHLNNVVVTNNVTSIGANAFTSGKLVIKSVAASKVSGWSADWNGTCTVIYGYDMVNDNGHNFIDGSIFG